MMTPKEFEEKMNKISSTDPSNPSSPQYNHEEADNLMCELLKSLGYSEGVKVFENMTKWYN